MAVNFDYTKEDKLSKENAEKLQKVLEEFCDDFYVPLMERGMERGDEAAEHWEETHFDSLVQGYILAKTGSEMLAQWSFYWTNVNRGENIVAKCTEKFK